MEIQNCIDRIIAAGFGGASIWGIKTSLGNTLYMGCLITLDVETVPGTNCWNWESSAENVYQWLADRAERMAADPEQRG